MPLLHSVLPRAYWRDALTYSVRLILLGTLVLAAVACRNSNEDVVANATPTPFPTEVAPRTIPEFTIRATEFAFDAPEKIDAGLVSITLTIDGREAHHIAFARIIDGKTFEDVKAVATQNQDPSALLDYDGGAGSVSPDRIQQVTIDLKPGNYALLCPVRSPDGLAHYAKGQLNALEVTPPTAPASIPPRADVTVPMRDFAFLAPTQINAEKQVWKITNEGVDRHEMVIVKPAPGRTYQDVLAYYQGGATGPSPAQSAGGFYWIDTKKSGWLTLDLPPGTYALTCRIPNAATGRIHSQLGMISRLDVK